MAYEGASMDMEDARVRAAPDFLVQPGEPKKEMERLLKLKSKLEVGVATTAEDLARKIEQLGMITQLSKSDFMQFKKLQETKDGIELFTNSSSCDRTDSSVD